MLRGKLICDFWVPGKPTALARARSTLMYVDAAGKKRMWHNDDPTPRKKSSIRTAMFTPKKNKGIRPMVPTLAMQSMRSVSQTFKPVDVPVVVDVCFCFQPNVSDSLEIRASKARHYRPHIQKPDIDNLNKMILDALSGHLYVDDTQVVSQNKFKVWGPHDGVRIRVHQADMMNMPDEIASIFPNGLDDKVRKGSLI